MGRPAAAICSTALPARSPTKHWSHWKPHKPRTKRRSLRSQGLLIGSNDLWIAATALHHEGRLVTRKLEHFARVPDIQLAPY